MRSMLTLGLVFVSSFAGPAALGAYTPLNLSGTDTFTLTELRPVATLSGSATLNLIDPGQINCGWDSVTRGFTTFKDSSTLNMSGGSVTSGAYRGLMFYDNSTFNFSGGLLASNQPVQMYGTSRMNFTDGLVTGHTGVQLFENSSLVMTGGEVSSVSTDHWHGIKSYDSSTVNITGSINPIIIDLVESRGDSIYVANNITARNRNGASSFDNSHLTLNDAVFTNPDGLAIANGSSLMDISSLVTSGGIQARDSAKITITNSQLNRLEAWNTAEIEIFGYGFSASAGLTLDNGRLYGEGILSGMWSDGTDMMFDVIVGDDSFIHVAPEPGTLALLAVGAAAGIRRRRK